jgi:hypothetical protein
MKTMDGLDKLDLTPRPVRKDFEIASQVIEAAHDWRLTGPVSSFRCGCGQAVLTAGSMTVGQLSMCLLAHLMQRHGWTREEVPSG